MTSADRARTGRAGAASRRIDQPGRDWAVSGLLLLAIGAAASGLGAAIEGVAWWFSMMIVAALVLAAATGVRMLVRLKFLGSLAAVIVALVAMTVMFASDSALLGFIPTREVLAAFAALEQAGTDSIAGQAPPATADQGIVYLLCLGVAAIAVVIDAIAIWAKLPALSGIPLIVLVLVPGLIRSEFANPLVIALTAVVYLGILLVGARRIALGPTLGLAAAAVIAALVVPPLLPTVSPSGGPSGDAAGGGAGLNPILALGDDLRRGEPQLAFSYETDSRSSLYFRLSALDDFSGETWRPTETDVDASNRVTSIPRPSDVGPDIPTATITSEVTIDDVSSTWLPAPYAPQSVTGLSGAWAYEEEGYGIRTNGDNARGQTYTVDSLQIAPSIEQLTATGTTVAEGLERYLEIPDELPAVVSETAAEIVGATASNYEKAIALQNYFRSDQFVYSEDAPVEAGYDGSGASVLGEFLAARSGYCVHYSSAMAAMARTLGIPARVAVGFTPGTVSPADLPDDQKRTFDVSTHDFHAWPELHFAGIGWVRFEPTPGRGIPPEFAPLDEDDPATPDIDESVPAPETAPAPQPSATPAPAPTATTTPTLPPEATPESGTTAATTPWYLPSAGLLLLLVLIPWIIRVARRASRLRAVDAGAALPGWVEIRETADDVGLDPDEALTPRQLAESLREALGDRGDAALDRLLLTIEAESYSPVPLEPASKDVRIVLRGLRESATVAARVRAALLPPSLFARWRR